jgi:hypothetical protein
MPYGTVNADVIQTSTTGGILGAGNASIMKNRIINGAMVISQSAGGASVTQTTSNLYPVDRFLIFGSVTSKFTAQQSSTAPVGFVNSLLITSSAATTPASGDLYILRQAIEGYNMADLNWGSANAKTVTLSFQVYSSLTGTFGGSLTNGDVNRSYPFSYTISSANTWTTISVTIAGPTSGTWNTTNGTGIRLYFNLGAGSTYNGTAGSWATVADVTFPTGSTSVVGTSGATFYITGVQLEVGSSATGYEYRLYNQELIACQRYYYLHASGNNYPVMGAGSYTINDARGVINFPVTMRTNATLSSASGTNYFTFYYASSSSSSCNSLTADTLSTTCAEVKNNTSITIVAGYASFVRTANASAFLAFSAEL